MAHVAHGASCPFNGEHCTFSVEYVHNQFTLPILRGSRLPVENGARGWGFRDSGRDVLGRRHRHGLTWSRLPPAYSD